MEVLTTKLIQSGEIKKNGIGVKICHNGSLIPCLLFADDSILFCKAKAQSFCKLKMIMDDFCPFLVN